MYLNFSNYFIFICKFISKLLDLNNLNKIILVKNYRFNGIIFKNYIINKNIKYTSYFILVLYSIILSLIVKSLFGFEPESIIAITIFLVFTSLIFYFNFKLFKFFTYSKMRKIVILRNMQHVLIRMYLIILSKLLILYFVLISRKVCYFNNLLCLLFIKLKYILHNKYLQYLIYFAAIYANIRVYINDLYIKHTLFSLMRYLMYVYGCMYNYLDSYLRSFEFISEDLFRFLRSDEDSFFILLCYLNLLAFILYVINFIVSEN